MSYRSNPPKMFLRKDVQKMCGKFAGEHSCRSAITIKLLWCSPVNLLHIFRTPFPKNSSGGLLTGLKFIQFTYVQGGNAFTKFFSRSNTFNYYYQFP